MNATKQEPIIPAAKGMCVSIPGVTRFTVTVVGGSHVRKCIRVRIKWNGRTEWFDVPVDEVSLYPLDSEVEITVTAKARGTTP